MSSRERAGSSILSLLGTVALAVVIAVLLKIFVFRKERRYGARVMSRGRRNYRGGRR